VTNLLKYLLFFKPLSPTGLLSFFNYYINFCIFILQFVVSPKWCVVAGEESREKENQKLRENRVLEAVYPRLSAIPPW